MDEDERRELDEVADPRTQAIHTLRRKQEFQGHLIAYITVNTLFWAIWLLVGLSSGAWFPWPIIPMAGWGIGIAMHAWSAFGSPSRPITEEQIDREMRRFRPRPSH